jgi:hypothetical protein
MSLLAPRTPREADSARNSGPSHRDRIIAEKEMSASQATKILPVSAGSCEPSEPQDDNPCTEMVWRSVRKPVEDKRDCGNHRHIRTKSWSAQCCPSMAIASVSDDDVKGGVVSKKLIEDNIFGLDGDVASNAVEV